MFQMLPESSGGLVVLRVLGKLTKQDRVSVAPPLEEKIREKRRLRSLPWQRGQGIRDVRRSERWGGDHDVHARHEKGATAHPRSASKHLARARSEDRKGDRQRYQARYLFCETCPRCGERIATEEDHRDRCAAQRLYRDGDCAARPDLR